MEEQKKNPAQGLSESEQVQVRRQKLADLQAAGRDPFTLTKFPQDAYSADLKEEFKDLPNETDSGKKVALAGRLMSKRVMARQALLICATIRATSSSTSAVTSWATTLTLLSRSWTWAISSASRARCSAPRPAS